MMQVRNKREVTLNEQDALQDMLECEKQLMGVYAAALEEGSTKALRKEIWKNYAACADGQFSVFHEMCARGYYPLRPASEEQRGERLASFKKIEKQLAQK